MPSWDTGGSVAWPAALLGATLGATLAVTLAGCGQDASPPEAGEPTSTTASGSADTGPQLPDGWRWESFGGVQVGVPGDWEWGNATQRTDQWCISSDEDRARPVVGRPGPTTLVGCPQGDPGEPPPDTLIENTGPVVGLARALDAQDGTRREGDRTTVVLRGVAVVVQVEPELREQIVATVHTVDGDDAYGCPPTDPIWSDPGRRPADPVDVTTIEGVTAVSVCRYEVAQPDTRVPGDLQALVSSSRLEGASAADVIRAVAGSPEGGGPDSPGDCLPEYSYGDEVVVLHVESMSGDSTVHVRYSGCDHHGFDDGVTVRTLTRDAIRPLLAGPHSPSSWSSRLDPILEP